jgi:pimeloyl-ACP methyl ester carboxylesterase
MTARRIVRTISSLIGILLLVLLIAFFAWVAYSNNLITTTETLSAEGAPGQFFEINGRTLHARITGDLSASSETPPVLVIHGFAASSDFWYPWAEGLQAEHTLIVVDLLGFGYSERVTEPTPDYSHQGQADLLYGLLNALNVEQVDIVAHSYGGAIAAQLALEHPERVRRIAFIAAQTYDVGEGGGNQMLGTMPFGIGRAVTFNILGSGPLSATIAQSLCPDCDPSTFEARLRTARIQGTTDALIAFSQSPRISRMPDDLPQLEQPALVIWGDQDNIVPLRYGEQLAQEVGAVDFIVFPGAGHVPFFDYPEQVLDRVLNFLRG